MENKATLITIFPEQKVSPPHMNLMEAPNKPDTVNSAGETSKAFLFISLLGCRVFFNSESECFMRVCVCVCTCACLYICVCVASSSLFFFIRFASLFTLT